MNLRKTLTLGAAIAAAGLLALTPTAQASTPTGGPANYIAVNGTLAVGSAAVNGIFKQGTATYSLLGYTTTCSGGTVAGTVARGPRPAATDPDFAFTTLSLTCGTPLGVNATMTIAAAAGCSPLRVTFPNPPINLNVHNGLIDYTTPWGTWFPGAPGSAKFHNVPQGSMNVLKCITVTLPGGCSATAGGTVGAQFSEEVRAVGGVDYQGLVLNAPPTSLTLYNATAACFGLMAGGLELNVRFNIKPTSGGFIDFRLNP